MTDDLPAIRADLVKISTLARGFTQLVVEIPSERAAKAIELLGVPTPGNSLWVAIAPLKEEDTAEQPKAVTEQPKAKKGYWAKSPSQRAGQMCADSNFWEWLLAEGHVHERHDSPKERAKAAATWLRFTLDIDSRSFLDTETESNKHRNLFCNIEYHFRQWAGYESSPERIPDPPTPQATAGQSQARTPPPPGNQAPPAGSAPVAHAETDPAAQGADKRQGIPELSPGELMKQVQERDGR